MNKIFSLSGGAKSHKPRTQNKRPNKGKRDNSAPIVDNNDKSIISVNSVDASDDTPVDPPKNIVIPPVFPQVGVMTNERLYNTPLSDFIWLEKTDGEHKNLIIYEGILYNVHHGKLYLVKQLEEPIQKETILDVELYDNRFYIFDCPMVDGNDISNEPFTTRIESASKFINEHKTLQSTFEVKQFNGVNSEELPKLIQTINTTNISPITHNKIDGIIFQNINLPYFYEKDYIVFKLKRRNLNTVDFKLIWDEEDQTYYLYLFGSYHQVLGNKKRLPYINTKSIKHTGVNLRDRMLPEKLYILFSSPYFEDLHTFTPDDNFNESGYFDDEVICIRKLMTGMLNNPKAYDGKIVELSLNNSNKWVPMRVRNDKDKSNAYSVGLSNCSVMFNPITVESIKDENLYFTKSKELFFDSSVITPYHDINKLVRKYMIERCINHTMTPLLGRYEPLNVLDLAGGRGADELSLYHCGATNIFAMDSDKTALVQYIERTDYTPRIKDFSFLLPGSADPQALRKNININAVYGWLGLNDKPIYDDIKSRYEFPKQVKNQFGNIIKEAGFDVILMNFAIHYLCDDLGKINELCRFVVSLLRPHGLFVFSCFDGERIVDIIDKNEGRVGPFVIEKLEGNIAKMPLPTIDASGYRAEPLVMKEHIEVFNKCEQLRLMTKFYPMDDVSKLEKYSEIEDPNKVSDFLHNIICYVYEKQ